MQTKSFVGTHDVDDRILGELRKAVRKIQSKNRALVHKPRRLLSAMLELQRGTGKWRARRNLPELWGYYGGGENVRARIKPRDLVTNKQKKVIAEFLEEEHTKKSEGNMRRILKVFCLVLNEDHGFGKGRLPKVIQKVSRISEDREKDEVFWQHVDMRMKQLGLDFEPEDYNEMDW
jgi:hypothetical protein